MMHIIAVVVLFMSVLCVSEASSQTRLINLPTNDLIYDAVTQKIYASVPSSAGSIGNSITVIDPVTGNVGPSVFVGSEPGKLAMTSDHTTIYVAVASGASVRRFDISSLAPGFQFALGNDSFFGPYRVEDMEAVPGTTGSVVISRKYTGVSPRHAGVAVFDNGVQRPTTTPGHTGSNVIEFSQTTSRLYGYNNETTEFGFRRMDLTASGISVLDATGSLFGGFGQDIRFDNGRIYDNCGDVIDPEARVYLGSFDVTCPALVRPDSARGLVFFVSATSFFGSAYELRIFDEQTFLQVGASIPISGVSGTVSSLIRWGGSGLAFRTSTNQVFLIDPSSVLTAASFLPLDPGNSWVYEIPGANFTRSVLSGTTIVNGVPAAVVQDSSGFVQYFTSDANGIRLHRQFAPNVFIDGIGTVDLTLTYSEPMKIANGIITLGETVNSAGTAQTNNLPDVGVQNIPYSSSHTTVGFETVTVPDGTFKALRINASVTFAGEVSTGVLYFAKNLGTVKEVDTTGGANLSMVLVSTNIVLQTTRVDFDGDGKSDIGIYRNGMWSIKRSSDNGNTVLNWGGPSWQPVPADYDGDGVTDIAVYNPNGLWSIIRSSDGGNTLIQWSGAAGDIPVPADYDGDGKADLAVYNPASAGWSIIRSSDGGLTYKPWGGPSWQPVVADWDGDGKADIAVYRASDALYSIVRSSDGGNTLQGWVVTPGDILTYGDYDGDGKTDYATYNPNSAYWSIIRSSDLGLTALTWGGPAYQPVAADYDGDGKADIAVYGANNGLWSIVRSSDVGNTIVVLGGGAQDVPLQ